MPSNGISPGACTENLIQAGMESLMPDGVSMRICSLLLSRVMQEHSCLKKPKNYIQPTLNKPWLGVTVAEVLPAKSCEK